MRIMRVDYIRLESLDDARKMPGSRAVHFGSRCDRNQLEPFVHPAPQLSIRMRYECRTLTDRPQAVYRQQDLILSAAPGSCRIDVEGEHLRFWCSGFRV